MFAGYFAPNGDVNDGEDRAAMNAIDGWSVAEAGSARTCAQTSSPSVEPQRRLELRCPLQRHELDRDAGPA
jgi:hypothetical protein